MAKTLIKKLHKKLEHEDNNAAEEDNNYNLIEESDAVEKREKFEKAISAQNNIWGYSNQGLEAKKAAMTMLSTKTGMYAKIPLVCKADNCPYADTCQLLPYDLAPVGEYCPIETSQIELRSVAYAKDMDIDNASFTDRTLLNEIVGYDVMLERCRALMAKEGTPVIDVVIGIAENGDEIKQPVVSKSWEAYNKIVQRRNEAYQLMMMTRKDNKDKTTTEEKSISQILAESTIDADDND